jgi:hypothetical protein
MDARRSDARDLVKVAAFSVALAVYVYVIGWLVTWVRLTAARLPIDASLPVIDDKVLLATGLRTVLLMAAAFAAMCAAAWATHAWTWDQRSPQWHAVVTSGRTAARAAPPAPDSTPAVKPPGDPFVRVVAGFNVGVLAAALGLAGARLIEPLIDQIRPGLWWALVGPWAVLSILATVVLVLIGPLRGGRVVHAILWAIVVVVAMLCSAPLGLLILTWAGIATLGRLFGRTHSPPGSKLEFVLSPLPWILLTIYALVGLAYYAVPPVSFSHTIITTASGTRSGGYLARTSAGVYVVTCTPLADATSTDEAVSFTPAARLSGMATGGTPFVVDSGRQPSLPTLALHALGIDAGTPTWIHPELRAARPTCAGSSLRPPSVGFAAPALGTGVIAGPAPPNGRANDGEPPIEQTTPGFAALARRYQPTILVTAADRFWPVSLGALLADLGPTGQPTCLHHLPGVCAVRAPMLTDLKPSGSSPDDFLQYPANPPLDVDPTGQWAAFLRGQRGLQTPLPTLHSWLADPSTLDPWSSAQVYFYYSGPADFSRYPARNAAVPAGLLALQYWFLYPYNYYPTAATPDLMNDAPLSGDVVNTDLHQGDWEHVTVLLDPHTLAPQWLYMARHSDEGQYYRWDSPRLTFDEGHPIVEAAFGGHPSYDAHCGARLRYAHGLNGITSDWIVCGSGRYAFRAQTTPLVDIAQAPWACWQGHFGIATPTEIGAAQKNEGSIQRTIDSNYFVAGPRSPLTQAENRGVCAGAAGPAATENEAIRSGLGRRVAP